MSYQLKSYATIFAFLLLGVFIFTYSINKKSQFSLKVKKSDEDFFEHGILRNSETFFSVGQRPKWKLKSLKVESFQRKRFYFYQPEVTLFKKKQDIKVRAKSGEFLLEEDILTLEGQVKLSFKDGYHQSEYAKLFLPEQRAELAGGVEAVYKNLKNEDRLFLQSQKANLSLESQEYFYRNEAHGRIVPAVSYQKPLHFRGDQINVFYLESRMDIEGQVHISKGLTETFANRGEFFLENSNNKLKYYVLYDDVRLIERKAANSEELLRRAFSEKLEGFSLEQKVVLTGTPRVLQGQDEIKGYRITLREDVDLLEVDDSASSFVIEKEQKDKK